MPQIGHEPGSARTISGCIGQVYSVRVAGAAGTSGSSAMPHLGQAPGWSWRTSGIHRANVGGRLRVRRRRFGCAARVRLSFKRMRWRASGTAFGDRCPTLGRRPRRLGGGGARQHGGLRLAQAVGGAILFDARASRIACDPRHPRRLFRRSRGLRRTRRARARACRSRPRPLARPDRARRRRGVSERPVRLSHRARPRALPRPRLYPHRSRQEWAQCRFDGRRRLSLRIGQNRPCRRGAQRRRGVRRQRAIPARSASRIAAGSLRSGQALLRLCRAVHPFVGVAATDPARQSARPELAVRLRRGRLFFAGQRHRHSHSRCDRLGDGRLPVSARGARRRERRRREARGRNSPRT